MNTEVYLLIIKVCIQFRNHLKNNNIFYCHHQMMILILLLLTKISLNTTIIIRKLASPTPNHACSHPPFYDEIMSITLYTKEYHELIHALDCVTESLPKDYT